VRYFCAPPGVRLSRPFFRKDEIAHEDYRSVTDEVSVAERRAGFEQVSPGKRLAVAHYAPDLADSFGVSARGFQCAAARYFKGKCVDKQIGRMRFCKACPSVQYRFAGQRIYLLPFKLQQP